MPQANSGDVTPPTDWATTRSLENLVELCGESLRPPKDIGVLAGHTAFSLTRRFATLGPITVGDIMFGAPVWMNISEERTNYHINVPVSGLLDSTHRGTRMLVHHGVAAVYQPQGHTVIHRWEGGGRTVFVNIDRWFVHDMLATDLGYAPARHVDFQPAMPTSSGSGRSWTELLLLFNHQLFAKDSLLHRPMIGMPLIDALVRGLLVAADHPHRDAMIGGSRRATPREVRAAVDFIEAQASSPLTVSMMAARSNVSVRTLQDGFRRHLGTTPMNYLRDVRLRRVHETLLESDPGATTVAAVAHRWGFGNLGRLATAYAALYGERPATTLRRQRSTPRSPARPAGSAR